MHMSTCTASGIMSGPCSRNRICLSGLVGVLFGVCARCKHYYAQLTVVLRLAQCKSSIKRQRGCWFEPNKVQGKFF